MLIGKAVQTNSGTITSQCAAILYDYLRMGLQPFACLFAKTLGLTCAPVYSS